LPSSYPIISADSHVAEPPNTYLDHIDQAWREKPPRMVEGGEGVVFPHDLVCGRGGDVGDEIAVLVEGGTD